MNLGYSWSVQGEAYHYLVSLPRRRRRKLERIIEGVAANPFAPAAFTLQDENGSTLEVIEREAHLFTYHPDHAIRRIRVVEIQPFS